MPPKPPYPPGLGEEWLTRNIFTAFHGAWFWLAMIAVIVLFFGTLALMQSLGSAQRRQLTVACTFIAGLFYTFTFFLPAKVNYLKSYEQPLGSFLLVMGGFTIGLGVFNLVLVHGATLLRARPGWINSLAFFLGFVGMTVFGLWNSQLPEGADPQRLPLAAAGFQVLFKGLLTPLQSTTFALLGFFIVSAAYRAFRIRSVEAGLMTVVAFVVMLGQVPVGQLLTSWLPATGFWSYLRIENVTNWLLTVPNTAATRGIMFGSAIGGFALSLRVWLSLERGSYFSKEY